jgi:hypothetical protein
MNDTANLAELCDQRKVTYKKITDSAYDSIVGQIMDTGFNGNVVLLEKAPRIAVFTPPNKRPWDDAVTLALTYAEIPFDKLYIDDVLNGRLDKYDWLHLHHEDFTGQFGRIWRSDHGDDWYQEEVQTLKGIAKRHNYAKVSQMELAVAKKIKGFVDAGGNLFAMCSASESLDIALAAEHTDICDAMYDGDKVAADMQEQLDYTNCLAFQNFRVATSEENNHLSSINRDVSEQKKEALPLFNIAKPPAKLDVVPAMLCQNHARTIVSFLGQTTAFRLSTIKPGSMILGEWDDEARYLHGNLGSGTWTFLSGHDPEDYIHIGFSEPTDLSRHANSPGYRLILNNVLIPAAKKTNAPTVTSQRSGNKSPAIAGKIRLDASVNELVVTMELGKVQQVCLFSISGKRLISQSFDTKEATVDIRSLAEGTYFVQVNNIYAGKLIKVIK